MTFFFRNIKDIKFMTLVRDSHFSDLLNKRDPRSVCLKIKKFHIQYFLVTYIRLKQQQ